MRKTITMLSLMLASLFVTSLSYGQYSSTAIRYGVKATDTTSSLQEVVVTAKPYPQTKLVGEYNQPAWTLVRKFPSTRVYLMVPPNTIMYEKWLDMRDRRNGPTEIRMRDEFAFGLGKRFELDLYMHTVSDGIAGDYSFKPRGFSWEIRYALADWGKLWGNPTLYFEHKFLNGRQGIEPKILLGDRIGKRGIWGVNLIYEANLGGTKEEQEREYAYTASYGYMVNNDLTVGVSNMFRYNDYEGTSKELYVGPLVQYRFNGHAYINVEHMPGLNQGAKLSRTIIIFGWRF